MSYHTPVYAYVATCVVICTILIILLTLRRRRRLHKNASNFSGPPTLPIIGNAHLFIGNSEDVLDRIIQLCNFFPTVFRIWLGNRLLIIVKTPQQFKEVLLSPKTMDKGPFYDFGQAWMGTGLLTASAGKWRVHRKIMQPTFSPMVLQSFIRTFAANSGKMVKKMERHLDAELEFDVYNYTSKCTLHTVCETTMGVDLGAETNDNGVYAKAVEQVIQALCKRVLSPWLHPDFIFNLTQLGKDQKKHIQFLHNFADNVIKSKKKLLDQSLRSNSADYEEDNTGKWVPRRKILLDHLIEVSSTSETLSDKAIREEVDTIIATGSDSTAVMSSYVMLMLASHPEIQEKLHQELFEIYGDNEGQQIEFSSENLTRMTYLERVIKETMRLFPITPILSRLVMEDLDIGEHTLPKGSLACLPIIDLHRNADYWPDPLKFDPDRFLPEEVQKRDSYVYIPFSGGPRSCIGSKYAMMSMKILLTTVLREYVLKKNTITPVKDLRFKWEFVLRPVTPISLRIERRTRKLPTV